MELSYETRTYHLSGLVTISTRIWVGTQYHWNRQVLVATPQDLENAAVTAKYYARHFGTARLDGDGGTRPLEEMEEQDRWWRWRNKTPW